MPATERSCCAVSTSGPTAATSEPTSRRCSHRFSMRAGRCAHPAQQHQRERRHSRIDRAQRASAAVLALAHAPPERQRPRSAGDASGIPASPVPARGRRAARGEPRDRVHHRHHGGIPRRDRGRPCAHPVTRRRGGVPPGARLSLVAAPGTPASTLGSRVDDATARRRSAEVRRATRRSGARSLARACGRVHEVAWDAVENHSAHGLTAGYHEVIVEGDAGIRQGALDLVRAETVLGDRLRCTLLRS